MKHDSRIIDKPWQLPRLHRSFFGIVTAAFWLLYAYLWLPLATLILWLIGIRTATFELYLREQAVEPFLLIALPVLAMASAALLIAWAEYNRFRFNGKDRRNAHANVGHDEIAGSFGASMEIALGLAGSKIAMLNMDRDAQPTGFSMLLGVRDDAQRIIPREQASEIAVAG
ncbi:biofilm PGA synthesis protein PgaD [Luteimonas cucumeris]|uniref:Biofilm PGA synthesis protein PgaD n=1 Tax=Luteimonas cucumeris TaxID=985012 RepID=A0A562L7U6_9GAMM|nr:poly-beta-1,6-N-acetyl-D-glucosamine biosynthesis protein PgaD [Luteimonas cucumeris]TWI03596.1 biofilm PGA synthesis protein PgaD [Luteimonas cucumeris]